MARFKLNSRGMDRLLKSPEVRADLTRRAQRVQAAAGAGAHIEQVTHDRAVVRVVGSLRDEADNGTLTRALRAAGGE